MAQTLVIGSKKYGEVIFVQPSHDSYVYVSAPTHLDGFNGRRQQICSAGRLTGNTIECASARFEHVARRWYAAFLRNNR